MARDPLIVAGFGFRRAATPDSLRDALDRAAGGAAISALATASDKAQAAPFVALAEALCLPVLAIGAETLAQQNTVTRSDASQRARGTGSVCEAAALAAAGPGAQLAAPRSISGDGMATCALAERQDR